MADHDLRHLYYSITLRVFTFLGMLISAMAFGLANYMGWTVRTIWLISGIGMLVTMFVDLILRAVTRNERKLPFDAEFLQISRAYGTYEWAMVFIVAAILAHLSKPMFLASIEELNEFLIARNTWTLNRFAKLDTNAWIERLIESVLLGALIYATGYWLREVTVPLRRSWLPHHIREAITRGKDLAKERQKLIDEAVRTFLDELPAIIANAERIGKRCARLTFQSKDGAISYGLQYDDLGWPDRDSKDCSGFVSGACLRAQAEGLAVKIVKTDDNKHFCVELRW